jgi:hypothetical protein
MEDIPKDFDSGVEEIKTEKLPDMSPNLDRNFYHLYKECINHVYFQCSKFIGIIYLSE